MIDISKYVENLYSFIHEETPTFLLSALREVAKIQERNGSWYDDVTITALIVRALKNANIKGWNEKQAGKYIIEHQLEDGTFVWDYTPNIWATAVIAPALWEMRIFDKWEKAKKFLITTQEIKKGFFGDPDYPWFTARVITNLIDSGESASSKSITLAKNWLIDKISEDHWTSMDSLDNPDEEVTAMCVVALIKSGLSSEHAAIKKALRWLKAQQMDNGSWHNDSHFTAHVLEAFYYANEEMNTSTYQMAIHFLKNDLNNWGRTWQPHSVGEIFFILSEVIQVDRIVSMPLDFAISEIKTLSGEVKELKNVVLKYDSLLSAVEKQKAILTKKPCLLTGGDCSKIITHAQNIFFVGYQFYSGYYNTKTLKIAIEEALSRYNITPFFPDEHGDTEHITCKICQKIQEVNICIFELSDLNSNVMLEIGLAYGAGKRAIIVRNHASLKKIPSDLHGIERIEYDDPLDLREKLIQLLPTLIQKDVKLK